MTLCRWLNGKIPQEMKSNFKCNFNFRCLPADANVDWAELRGCVTEPTDSTVIENFGAITQSVANDINDIENFCCR